jgi:hypothetical protein
MAAHELRYLYRRGRDLPDARRRLHDVLSRCVFSDVPELLRLARTLDAWRDELLAYFTTGGVSEPPIWRRPPVLQETRRTTWSGRLPAAPGVRVPVVQVVCGRVGAVGVPAA